MNRVVLKIRKVLSGRETSHFITFLFRFMILFLTWKVLFHFIWTIPTWLNSYNSFSLVVIDFILANVSWFLEALGYHTEIIPLDRLVKISGTIGVSVGEPCIGFGVQSLYIALILSYGNKWKEKIWFIVWGSVIIYSLNIMRISGLALLVQFNQDIWELNHKLIFKGIIYATIFFMWQVWVKRVQR